MEGDAQQHQWSLCSFREHFICTALVRGNKQKTTRNNHKIPKSTGHLRANATLAGTVSLKLSQKLSQETIIDNVKVQLV